MLEKTGIPTSDEIEEVSPSKKRLKSGPVAIAECFRQIPCDPCYHSCTAGAFAKFEDINNKPNIDHDKCTGCGVCISNCPGLAIFVVDYNYTEKKGLVKIPYEYLPLPKEGDEVVGLDRQGKEVCKATVEKVEDGENKDKTFVIWLLVPKDKVMDVRNMKVGE